MKIDLDQQKRIMEGRLQYYDTVFAHRPDEYKFLKLRFSIPNTRRALEKIKEGTYGICDECGEKISPKRLIAVPAAIRCISCQHDVEVTPERAT